MGKIYFLDDLVGTEKNAGSKARADARKIFLKQGYTGVNVVRKMGANVFEKLISYIQIFLRLRSVPENSVIVLQFPLMNVYRIHKAVESGKYRTIVLVHDLDFLRGAEYQKENYEILFKADAVISHNPKMTEVLKQMGVSKEKIVNLGIFDYLLEGKPVQKRNKENSIVFAGNIEKSPFCKKLKELNLKNTMFRLYGASENPDSLISKNVEYEGVFTPDEVPYKINGGYSLVWDGDSLETCSGPMGNYQQYNNPHKVSLSIISRLPVILWENAALADFVLHEKIGFTVKNLFELDEKISSITDEQYEEFQKNLERISEKLADGFYLERALKNAERIVLNGGGTLVE